MSASITLNIHSFEQLKPTLHAGESYTYIAFENVERTGDVERTERLFSIFFDCEHHARQMFAMLETWQVRKG